MTTTAEASLIKTILISSSWASNCLYNFRHPGIRRGLLFVALVMNRTSNHCFFKSLCCYKGWIIFTLTWSCSPILNTIVNLGIDIIVNCDLFRNTWYDLELSLFPTDVTNHYSGFPITRSDWRMILQLLLSCLRSPLHHDSTPQWLQVWGWGLDLLWPRRQRSCTNIFRITCCEKPVWTIEQVTRAGVTFSFRESSRGGRSCLREGQLPCLLFWPLTLRG